MSEAQVPDPEREAPDFSLVVLCYRAGEFAREFAGRAVGVLEAAGIESFELVLVGNYVEGSEDPTPRVVREVAEGDPRIRSIARPKEGMMGWDMRSGLREARGKRIGVIDGDGQMPLSEVGALYDLMCREGYDLVKTFRITRGDGLRRRFISNVYNKLVHLLFPGIQARDMNSKPKILTREAYEKLDLESDDWFIDAEIMIQARRLRLRIGELPTGFLGLTGRRSFVKTGAIVEFFLNLIRYRIREFGEKQAR
jgi:glycosyltransferase involved in cell wall biosynthesis